MIFRNGAEINQSNLSSIFCLYILVDLLCFLSNQEWFIYNCNNKLIVPMKMKIKTIVKILHYQENGC